jgi:lactoylglutathione lyase
LEYFFLKLYPRVKAMNTNLILIHIILYVSDLRRSKEFYKALLETQPVLDEPGMVEFKLTQSCKLGLMPEQSIAKILSTKTPHPSSGNSIPRCELYLLVENALEHFNRAKMLHAPIISDLENRDWGDKACYFSDPDGHVIAFAEKIV